MKNKVILCTVFLILLTSNSFAFLPEDQQCTYNGIDYQVAKTFQREIKIAVRKNDKNKIAAMAEYPVRINKTTKAGKHIHYFIKTKHEFIQQYNFLFNAKGKKSITDDKELFCNYQGAMLGGGVIWFKTEKDGAKIFSMNIW